MVSHISSLKEKVEKFYSEASLVLCDGSWNPSRQILLENLFSSERRTNFHRPDYPYRNTSNPDILYTDNEALITFNFEDVYLPKTGVVNRIVLLNSLGTSNFRELPVTVDYNLNRLIESVPGSPFAPGFKFYDPSTNTILDCIDFNGTINTPIPPSITFVVPIGRGVVLANFRINPIVCSESLESVDFKIVAKETIS